MPMSAGAAARTSWVVATRSLPMATACSFTPCSAPHSQVGHDSRAACAPVSPMLRYWVRNVHPAEARRPKGHADLHLAGGSVGVLGEHHAPGAGGAQRVAHGRSVGARLQEHG